MYPGRYNQNQTPQQPHYQPQQPPYQQPPYQQPPYQQQQPYQHQMPVQMPNAFTQPQQQQQPFLPYMPHNTKKALLIGINYFGKRNELKGCCSDALNMKNFLISHFHFQPENMILLLDTSRDPLFQPTRFNILNALKWLVGGAKPGDSLFLHYSGHGGLVKDLNGDEESGYDSCIYPVDWEHAGHIIDDDLHTQLVQYLPPGVRLTVIFDCCHSGTGLDLPFIYNHDGTLKDGRKKQLTQIGMDLIGGRDMSAIRGATSLLNNFLHSNNQQQQQHQKMGYADVFMFSGCKDNQTSKDTFIGGYGATGAMSFAFIKCLQQNPQQSYLSLLSGLRMILEREYGQKPQLSTARPMDMQTGFFI